MASGDAKERERDTHTHSHSKDFQQQSESYSPILIPRSKFRRRLSFTVVENLWCLIRRVKNRGELVQLSPWEVTVSGNVVGFGGRFGSWALGGIKFEDSMPFDMFSSHRSSAGLISCCLSFSVCGVGAIIVCMGWLWQ